MQVNPWWSTEKTHIQTKLPIYYYRRISLADTCLLAIRLALLRGHEFYLGLFMEQGKSYKNAKGKAQAGQTSARLNTEVLYDGGLGRSSDEAFVMKVERRAGVVQLELPLPPRDKAGRSFGF